jgi:mannose-1-phosphate guanylyltransferase
MSDRSHVFVNILAGGGGTRLWPKSREKTPKQFLRLYTENTLLQDTYRRARLFTDPSHILIISNKNYIEDVAAQLPELPRENIVGEPAKRETGPAMLLGAMLAYSKDPDAVIINLASDHIATNEEEFQHVVETAVEVASEQTSIVTVGITPTFPHSGLGYIRIDDELKRVNRLPVFKVDSFTEKPNEATAKAFIATGKYFWNACNYVWGAKALFQAFEKYSPDMLSAMKPVLDAIGTSEFAPVLASAYEKVEKIAIDYAISEKADNLVLIPGDFGWNDIGDWKVVYDLREQNEAGNVLMCESNKGQVVCHDSQNNLVHTHDRLIALVGMTDTIVIDTGEILLVMPKNRSQDVKKIVEEIKEKNPSYL